MEKTKENAPELPRLSRLPRFRKIRVFFYVFLVLVALIVIPATLLPPWLATKGIEINAISGISIGKRITIDELTISINSNTITINQLVLERFVDAESAISDASWRLSSPETTIQLAPSIRQATYHQGVKLSDIHLHNVAFNLTDLSPPYVFSAKAELASMFLKSKSAQPITQQIHDLSLVLTTEPYVALTGDFNQAKLTAFHPADVHTYQYPIDINKTHFSISWQPYNTPLNIHINRLNPKWASVTNPFEQLGENVTFSADLSHMKNSIKLTADTLALDQPVSLPEFIDKPDDEHEGLHLGRAIANLAQLPLQKVKIKHFSYGELIINSKLVIETPRVRMNKPNKPAKLHLKGQALGPDPYGIDVLVKHTGELDAHFTGTMTDPNGNSIHCAANVNFANPLPKALTCEADLEHTQDLTNKLKLFDMPHAKLTKPIVLEAKQTHLILSEKVTQTTKDTVSDQSANKQQEQAQAQPIKPHYQYQDVIKAGYKIDITLPESLKVNLNRYAFDRPKMLASDKAISSIKLNTDGTLSLMALYENDTIRLKLSDSTIAGNAAEKLTFANQQIKSRLSTHFSQFNCQIPFSLKGRKAKLKQSVKPKEKASHTASLSELHCHAKLMIDSAIGALYPTPTLSLSQISAKTVLILDWTEKALQAELSNLDIKVDSAQISLDGNWVETKADDLQVTAKRIEILQQYQEEATQAFSLKVGQS
ncbi:hypothetical protein, partial [Photobacterium sanctipauli]